MGATFKGKMNQSVIKMREPNVWGSYHISNKGESRRIADRVDTFSHDHVALDIEYLLPYVTKYK